MLFFIPSWDILVLELLFLTIHYYGIIVFRFYGDYPMWSANEKVVILFWLIDVPSDLSGGYLEFNKFLKPTWIETSRWGQTKKSVQNKLKIINKHAKFLKGGDPSTHCDKFFV